MDWDFSLVCSGSEYALIRGSFSERAQRDMHSQAVMLDMTEEDQPRVFVIMNEVLTEIGR